MPTPVDTSAPGRVYHVARTEVATKNALSDGSWTIVPYLYADSLSLRVNAVDEATLSYEFGKMMRPGEDSFGIVQPLDLAEKFVRIRTFNGAPPEPPDTDDSVGTPVVTWYGYVIGDVNSRNGVQEILGQNEFMVGTQRISAVGLEYFLGRSQVDSAVVWDANAASEITIQRPLIFNAGGVSGLTTNISRRGNKKTGAVFFDQSASSEEWDGEFIIEYLLANHAANFPCTIGLGSFGPLEDYKPVLDTRNMTVFDLFNTLANPRRGYVWWLEYDDGGNSVDVKIDTLATSSISLPDGGTIPANANQITLDFDSQLDVLSGPTYSRNLSAQYDYIKCRGNRLTCTFTLGFGDGTLEKDWLDAQETAYKAGASGEGGYAGLSEDDKKTANDAFRAAEQFARVYGAFRIPADWDGTTGDGGGNFALAPALPILSTSGSVLGGTPLSLPGLRLLNETLLKEGWDYTDAANPTSVNPSGTEPQFAAPFAMFEVSPTQPNLQFAHAIGRSNFLGNDDPNENKISYHLRMQGTAPGVELRAGNGRNHGMAINQWGDAEPSNTEPEVDYETLRVTVSAEADAFAEGVYPATAIPATAQVLVIQLSDEYRLDYLAPKTVFDLDNGAAKVTNGGILRDDRARLRDIARLAYEWYWLPRRVLSMGFRQVRDFIGVGNLITTVGTGTTQTSVNTVVGMVSYDFLRSTTSIETLADQFDPRSVA